MDGCSALRACHSSACAALAALSSSASSRRNAAIEPLLPRAAAQRSSTTFATNIMGLSATKISDRAFRVTAYRTPPIANGISIDSSGKRWWCWACGSSGHVSAAPA